MDFTWRFRDRFTVRQYPVVGIGRSTEAGLVKGEAAAWGSGAPRQLADRSLSLGVVDSFASVSEIPGSGHSMAESAVTVGAVL